MIITTESITDDQIRALRDELVSEIARLASTPEVWTMPLDKALVETDWALSTAMQPAIVDRRRAARIRCAEIFNARKAAA